MDRAGSEARQNWTELVGRIFSNPKIVTAGIVALLVVLVSVAGGAFGVPFGGGFIGGPIPFISLPGERIAMIGGYSLQNTTVTLWLSMSVLILLAWLATRRLTEVPGRLQSMFEAVFQFFADTAESTGGPAARRFLPLVITIFLGVLIINWTGLLPGVGSIGRIESIEEWVHHHADDEIEAIREAHPELGDTEIEVIATLETLLHSADETFVVFDGERVPTIPLGRGERQRAPLSAIVPFDEHLVEEIIEELEHGVTVSALRPDLADEWHKSEDLIHAGAVQQVFLDQEGDSHDFTGKTAGILVPYLRGAATDVNTTLAIALVAMVSVQFFGIRALGIRGYGGKFIMLKQGPIFMFVGLLELAGEFIRVLSFTFRLFGNMFAGEVLLFVMGFLLPLIGILPFLGLELFVGLIQAFIFAMLTLVFASMAVQSHGDHDDHGAHEAEEGQAAH